MLLRNLFAIVAGLFATMIVATFLSIAHAHFVFPPPVGMDWRDPVAVGAFAASMTPLALGLLVLAWVLAAFAGGFACARLAGSLRTALGVLIGALVAAGNAYGATTVAHPQWMEACNVALPPLSAWLGAWLAQRPRRGQNGLASTR